MEEFRNLYVAFKTEYQLVDVSTRAKPFLMPLDIRVADTSGLIGC